MLLGERGRMMGGGGPKARLGFYYVHWRLDWRLRGEGSSGEKKIRYKNGGGKWRVQQNVKKLSPLSFLIAFLSRLLRAAKLCLEMLSLSLRRVIKCFFSLTL